MVNVAMNRPVHLARRDAHYYSYLQIMKKVSHKGPLEKRRDKIEGILRHLKEAYQEARYAVRGFKAHATEEQFIKYLDLLYDAAKAAAAMVQHETLLEEDKSFLNCFLGVETEKIMQSERCFERMGRDIINGMDEIVSLAGTAYNRLRRANMNWLSPDDRERYQSAYQAAIRGEAVTGRRTDEESKNR